MNNKKQLALRIIQGVDQIKVALFAIFSNILDETFDVEIDACGRISATIVNDIYGCHTPQTEIIFSENQDTIRKALLFFAEEYCMYKLLITTSVQYYITSNFTLGAEKMKNVEYTTLLIDNLKEKGLFEISEEQLDFNNFLDQAQHFNYVYT